jgi:hypothetical protein
MNNKRSDSMFLVKQEQDHQKQHPSTSSSSSSSTTSNPIESSNSFNIDAVSSSSPYGHIEYTNNPNHFWSLPPYVTS